MGSLSKHGLQYCAARLIVIKKKPAIDLFLFIWCYLYLGDNAVKKIQAFVYLTTSDSRQEVRGHFTEGVWSSGSAEESERMFPSWSSCQVNEQIFFAVLSHIS